MSNSLRWQVPGNGNPFDSKLEDWQESKMSTRSIGVLQFVNQNNPTKEYFETNIKEYLYQNYKLEKNDSNEAHFYRPLEFIDMIYFDKFDNKMYLSIDGKNFLNYIDKKEYKKAINAYILQLLKTKYPNSATNNITLNLFPFRILFKLLLTQDVTEYDICYKIPYISSPEDINKKIGEKYVKWQTWVISYLIKLGIILKEGDLLKINTKDFSLIADILNDMKFEEMFFDETNFYIQNKIRKTYTRNPRLTKNVLEKHNYKCINDTNHITFQAPSMINYVEGHHIMPMHLSDSFDFCLDIEENIVPLCPNCHRAIHLGVSDVKHKIIDKILDIQNLSSLKITKQDLYAVYQ